MSWRVVRPLTASTISAKMLGGPRWSFRFPAYRDLLSLHADDAIAIAANELDRRGR